MLKEYETYVDRMIEEEWLGSDEDDWIEAEELPFDWKNLGIHINENELMGKIVLAFRTRMCIIKTVVENNTSSQKWCV